MDAQYLSNIAHHLTDIQIFPFAVIINNTWLMRYDFCGNLCTFVQTE